MPHVIVKLYPGRSLERKRALSDRIVKALEETIGSRRGDVSVSFEEVSPREWEERVVKPDILGKTDALFKRPEY